VYYLHSKLQLLVDSQTYQYLQAQVHSQPQLQQLKLKLQLSEVVEVVAVIPVVLKGQEVVEDFLKEY
jgi:hypothetical protein